VMFCYLALYCFLLGLNMHADAASWGQMIGGALMSPFKNFFSHKPSVQPVKRPEAPKSQKPKFKLPLFSTMKPRKTWPFTDNMKEASSDPSSDVEDEGSRSDLKGDPETTVDQSVPVEKGSETVDELVRNFKEDMDVLARYPSVAKLPEYLRRPYMNALKAGVTDSITKSTVPPSDVTPTVPVITENPIDRAVTLEDTSASADTMPTVTNVPIEAPLGSLVSLERESGPDDMSLNPEEILFLESLDYTSSLEDSDSDDMSVLENLDTILEQLEKPYDPLQLGDPDDMPSLEEDPELSEDQVKRNELYRDLQRKMDALKKSGAYKGRDYYNGEIRTIQVGTRPKGLNKGF